MRTMSAMAHAGISNSSLDSMSETNDKIESKQEKKEKVGGIKATIPGVMLTAQLALSVTPFFALSPLIVIPVTMFTLNTTAYVLRETPGRLLMPLIGMMNQRGLLTFNGVRIEDYYGYSPSLSGSLSSSSSSSSSSSPRALSSSSSAEITRSRGLDSSAGVEIDLAEIETPIDKLLRHLRLQFPDQDAHIDRMCVFFQYEEIEELEDVAQMRDEDWIRLNAPVDIKNAAITLCLNPSSLV